MSFRESTQIDHSHRSDYYDRAVVAGGATVAGRVRTAGSEMPVAENEILRELPPDMYRLLEPMFRQVQLKKEQFIYQEDDRLDYIYFPVTAVISEFKMLEDGRMVEIAVTGKEG